MGPPIDAHIPIPDASSYGIAILVVYSLGAITLAAELYSRWFSNSGVRVLDVYSGVLILPCLWGLALFSPRLVLGSPAPTWAIALPIGLAVGGAASWCDRRVVRAINRRSLAELSSQNYRRVADMAATELRILPQHGSTARLGNVRRRILGLNRPRRRYDPALIQRELRLPTVIAVAVGEELVYRGVMVRASFILPASGLVILALISLVSAFALNHIWFGWTQVLAKLPLSILATASVLALGTVVPAVFAHVLFNVKVLQDVRANPRIAALAQSP